MTRASLGLAAAVALVATLLVLPAPHRPAAATPVPAAQPATVATVWPHARTFGFPAVLPDGSTFSPITIVDPDLAVGGITDQAGGRYSLGTVTPAGAVRVVATFGVGQEASVDAIAATGTDLYWMQTRTDAAGTGHTTLWRAARAGGRPLQITGDVGSALFANSGHDLQIVGGRLYWIAAPAGDGHPPPLRSIPLSGGRVSVRELPGDYVLAAWPWLTTSPGAAGDHAELENLTTGARRAVSAAPGQMISCTRVWCRLTANNARETQRIQLIHPDGSDRQQLGDANSTALGDDVALRDRFEVIANPTPASGPTVAIERVYLCDLTGHRSVLLAPAASDGGARGDYVWWSTGDNETLAWHALDLRSLD